MYNTVPTHTYGYCEVAAPIAVYGSHCHVSKLLYGKITAGGMERES